MDWKEAQEWERDWHGSCGNTINEEIKQTAYAEKMGLERKPNPKTPYSYDLRGASVLDIGGGPVSLLLKCCNGGKLVVADPCDYPEWVSMRYKACGISLERIKGEDITFTGFDEVWIYNCLQHTEDYRKVLLNARRAGNLIRIFEWVNHPITAGHNHILREKELNDILGGEGKVEAFKGQSGLGGPAYYGIFPCSK